MSRKSVLDALKLMSRSKDVIKDTHGNVSERHGNRVYIKPSGVDYDKISKKDICVVSIDRPHDNRNRLKPSVDTIHHIKIYKSYPWVKSICHTHSPYAVAHAICYKNIVCRTTEQADYFGADVRCLPYSSLDSWGKDCRLREFEKAVLLEKHGALTFGENAVDAVKLAIALENLAFKNYLAETLHEPRMLSNVEIERWHKRYNEVYGQKDDSSSE